MQIAILGASKKPERYAYKAMTMLKSHGYAVAPVNQVLEDIEGTPVFKSLADIPEKVHTLTLYIGPKHIKGEIEAILALKPGRVIFNPGTESDELMKALDEAGIPYLEACTLVLLSTGQFESALPVMN